MMGRMVKIFGVFLLVGVAKSQPGERLSSTEKQETKELAKKIMEEYFDKKQASQHAPSSSGEPTQIVYGYPDR